MVASLHGFKTYAMVCLFDRKGLLSIQNLTFFQINLADVRLSYLKRPYAITMGTFQMAILLCLNSQTSISVKELQESTQLPEKDLIKQVQSLLEAKLITLNPLEQAAAGKVCFKFVFHQVLNY